MGFSGAKIAPCPPYTPLGTIESSKGLRPSRALRGFFDSLGRGSKLPRHCHPLQSPLKIEDFSGAEPARKRFFLWKMGFSDAKTVPCPPYMPPGTIESSKGLRPSRALRGFFRQSEAIPRGNRFSLSKKVLTSWWTGKQAPRPGAAPQIYDLSRRQFRQGRNLKTQRVFSLPATLTSLR